MRELHNDLIKTPEQEGLEGAVNDSGEIIIRDTALRAHLPKNLKKMTPRYKQICCCEICAIPKSLTLSLNSWHDRRMKRN